MSSNDGAFLYVGIVAIWACFLIPALIRRPHGSPADLADLADLTGPAQAPAEATSWPEEAEHLEETEDVQGANTAQATEATDGTEAGAAQRTDTLKVGSRHQAGQRPQYRDRVRAQSAVRPPLRATGPSQSRQQMLRARRRMLTILLSLSLLTIGFALLGLVQWWICAPPITILALYVLLLREIAMADAELAARRAASQARAQARARAARAANARAAHAERVARQRRHEEWAAMATEPGAEIIDISSRVGDQLYDQYADAAVRAVGD